MLKLRKNKKGFTLVELIVVVAIMAVLAGTVAGVVVSTQNKTKNSQADSSAKSVANQIATMLNSDWQSTADTSKKTYITASGTDFSGFSGTKIISDLAASYDTNEIKSGATDIPKAGSNSYNVVIGNAGKVITVTYTTLGTSKDQKGYTVEYNATSDTFKVREFKSADKAAAK